MTPFGVVLAGGASRRMGQDKALIEVGGTALALRVASALLSAGCEPVLCQGGDPQALAAVGLAVLPDSAPGAGPVRAIADALGRAEPADLVVAACDLPGLDADTVRSLLAAAAIHPTADAVFARYDGRAHLVSFWRSRALPRLTAAIEAGVESYGGVIEQLGALAVDVRGSAVHNVNRPGDLA